MPAILDAGWGVVHKCENGTTRDHFSSNFTRAYDFNVIFSLSKYA